MSQNDLVIDNQAGAPFRLDLNSALQALASQQAGSVAPTTTYPFQFWADMNAGVMRMRNAANNAWVTIGLLGVANFGHMMPGTIFLHSKNAAPAGALKANGAAVSRAAFSDLFNEIGTTFGAGDGSTTFNLPELRGEFLRGWDDSRGVDAGRAFGSAQAQNLPNFYLRTSMGFAGGIFYGWEDGGGGVGNPVFGSETISSTNRARMTGVEEGASPVRLAYTENIPKGVTGELRSRNIALLACIKY